MDKTKSIVLATGTYCLTLSVIAAQVGLYMGAVATNLLLYGLIATKNAGTALLSKFIGVEKSVETQILTTIGAINGYAKELRKRIETKAIDAYAAAPAPEDVLLRAIQKYSTKLNQELGKLREHGAKHLSVSTLNRVETAIGYVEKLDENFAKANTIEDIKSEVFEEAKQKLQDLAQWSASLIHSMKEEEEEEAEHSVM